MALITKAIDFSGMTGKCHACNKKLPKKLAYWCNATCFRFVNSDRALLIQVTPFYAFVHGYNTL